MPIDVVKLFDTIGEFLTDATVTGGTFSTSVDQGSGHKGIKGKTLDTAGNLSGFGTEKKYYAGCTNVPTCDLLDDTGASSTDNLTNDDTPRIKVEITLPIPTGCTSVAASSVKTLELHHKIGTMGGYSKIADLSSITPTGNDKFEATHQFASAIDEDDHYFKAIWVDNQNGTSGFGAELHIVVDTSAPNTPSITIDDGSVFVGDSVEISGTATE